MPCHRLKRKYETSNQSALTNQHAAQPCTSLHRPYRKSRIRITIRCLRHLVTYPLHNCRVSCMSVLLEMRIGGTARCCCTVLLHGACLLTACFTRACTALRQLRFVGVWRKKNRSAQSLTTHDLGCIASGKVC
jgi:hypothetical protein